MAILGGCVLKHRLGREGGSQLSPLLQVALPQPAEKAYSVILPAVFWHLGCWRVLGVPALLLGLF